MTAIKLLEKLGADATFDPSLLSLEDKKTLEDIIQKAQIFNAVEIVYAPDE
jgi:DNA-binding protein YbaB